MKLLYLLVLSVAGCLCATAQTSDPASLVHKWKYLGTEEFGVITPPDSLAKNDWLLLKSDGTFEWMQSGKNHSGTWKLNEPAKIISITDSKTNKTSRYNLKKVSATDLIIEYQTPDLVRTRYHYQVAE